MLKIDNGKPPLSIMPNGTRLEHGVLTPASETSINASGLLGVNRKKRKRASGDEAAPQDQRAWTESFTVRPHPLSVFAKPRTLTPLLLVARTDVPLSYLDTTNASTALPSSRLFSSDISALEEPPRDGPVVLVARLDADQTRYAVERVERGVYALCKLGNWVRTKELRVRALAVSEEYAGRGSGGVRDAGGNTGKGQSAPSLNANSTEGRVCAGAEAPQARVVSVEKREPQQGPSRLSTVDATSATLQEHEVLEPEELELELPELLPPPVSEQTVKEVLEMVRSQYLDALYVSKGSLAYFAKGPLSRARANLQIDGKTGSPALGDFLTFLKNSVLHLSLMDKKYRASVLDKVKSLPMEGLSEDDTTAGMRPAKIRKRKKGARPGKDGLWPGEEDYITKWWRLFDHDVGNGSPFDSHDRHRTRKIAELRTRETELQLILVLEILALEKCMPKDDGTAIDESATQTRPNESVQKEGTKGNASTKSKSSQMDLNLVLDLLIDKLSIWQSLGSEDFDFDGSSSAMSAGRDGRQYKNAPQGTGSDHLRDFCVEVILPFYSARLPEKCVMIHQKLGGHTSPARPPPAKTGSSSKPSQRPGEATRRTAPKKAPRTLERVLTDEKMARASSRRPSVPPALSRSATAPAVPGLKREASEVPLSAIPEKNASRPGIQNTKRFSQREVDLSAAAKATEARMKKKASVAEHLRNAISTLRKPNRGLAVKELADFSEQRARGCSNNASDGAQVSAGTAHGRAVQVMVTPKGNRKKDVFALDTPTRHHAQAPQAGTLPVPKAMDPCIPSSGIRPRDSRPAAPDQAQVNALPISWAGSKTDVGCGDIQVTPCRGSKAVDTRIFDSAIKDRPRASEAVFSTPLLKQSVPPAPGGDFSPSKKQRLANTTDQEFHDPLSCTLTAVETPLKRKDTHFPAGSLTAAGHGANWAINENDANDEDDDLYRRLGWED